MLREIAGNSDYFITLFDPVVIDWPEQIILTCRRSFENCFICKDDFVWLPVISPPGSFATNQLAIKIFILSISTEVDNKRATINAHIFFSRIVFKITQVALFFCDFLVMIVQ